MKYLLLLYLACLFTTAALGQDSASPAVQSNNWDVFLQRNDGEQRGTDLIFIDSLTGEANRLSTSGERFTLVDGGVIFFDIDDAQVKLAKPDGVIRDHPFISKSAGDYRVDWVVSPDNRHIAWTVSRRDESGQFVTTVSVADAAGSAIRELFVYGPREGIRLLPVAFSSAGTALYLEAHVEGTSALKPYTVRTGVFALDFASEEVQSRVLPGDPSCFCAIEFGPDFIMSLPQSDDSSGVNVALYDLASGTTRVIPSLSRGNYSEAGNILINPENKLAVYALSQAQGWGTPAQEIRTVLVKVDLDNAQQEIINSPLTGLVRPIAWTEDNSAVLFTTDQLDGTWKISPETAQLARIADAAYLGMTSDS